MASLVILKDPTGTTGKEVYHVDNGEYAIDVLMKYAPNGINQETQTILLNGKKVELTLDHLEVALKENDILVLVNEVKDPTTIAYAVIAIVAAVLAVALAPTPEIPNQSGQQKQSPNNQLQGQSNIARTYQSWPLVLGSPVTYPDLIGEPIEEYTNDIKQVRQFFLLGFGEFRISEVRTGSTPINNFSSANYTQYSPVAGDAVIPDYVTSFKASEVDGQILKGTNEDDSSPSIDYTSPMVSNQLSFIGATTAVFYVNQNADMDAMKAFFDANGSFQSTVIYEIWVDPMTGGEPPVNEFTQGTGTVDEIILQTGGYYRVKLIDFNGEAGDDELPLPQDVSFSQGGSGEITAVNLPVQCDDVWINLGFNRGLRGADENTNGTVSIEVLISELSSKGGASTGFSYQQTYNIVARTLNPVFETIKIGANNLNGRKWYKATIRRINTSSLDAAAPDECRAESLQCISYYANKSFGDATLLEVNIPATQNATATRQTKINLTCTAKTPTYNTTTQTVETTLNPSRRFADAILHMHINYYGLEASLLDLDALYEIQERLDLVDPQLGLFDFTFDDNDISYQDRLETILNVARCYTWQDGDVWRFGRDEAKEITSGLISRRDIAGEDREYSITFNSHVSQNFDGIRLEYVDRSINKKAYINRAIDSSGIILNQPSANPKLIELAGCQSLNQAENRADLEVRKLIYQRETLVETCLPSMTFLDKGDVVLYAEQYESRTFDGEILSIDGETATTTELIEWESGKDYSVRITSEDGSLRGPFNVTPVGIDGSFKFKLEGVECRRLSELYNHPAQVKPINLDLSDGVLYVNDSELSKIFALDNGTWSDVTDGDNKPSFAALRGISCESLAIYVTDTSLKSIYKKESGSWLDIGGGLGAPVWKSPIDVTVDNGVICVVDSVLSEVWRFGSSGAWENIGDYPSAPAWQNPVSISLSDNSVYVSDRGLGQIWMMDQYGLWQNVTNGINTPSFSGLAGISASNGNIYISDTDLGGVFVKNTSGEWIEMDLDGEQLAFSNGVTSENYVIYIADFSGSKILRCGSEIENAYTRDGIMGYEIKTGSRYIISETATMDAAKWCISSKESASERNTRFTMLNYDSRVYEND